MHSVVLYPLLMSDDEAKVMTEEGIFLCPHLSHAVDENSFSK